VDWDIWAAAAVLNLFPYGCWKSCYVQAKNCDRPQLVPFREHNMNSSGMQHAARRNGEIKYFDQVWKWATGTCHRSAKPSASKKNGNQSGKARNQSRDSSVWFAGGPSLLKDELYLSANIPSPDSKATQEVDQASAEWLVLYVLVSPLEFSSNTLIRDEGNQA
jgi:hypothetical protein